MAVFSADLMKGKVALVTGGGSGIGKAIANALGRHGARVVICSRKQEVLEKTRAEFEAQGIECLDQVCDVRDVQAVEALMNTILATFGRLDIVINNAAGNFPARIEDLSSNAFKTIVDIDLQGTFNVSKAAFTAALKEHGGVVINITAPFEHMGVAWQAHTAAAKSGIISFTRTAAVEWAPLGVRVNAIAPGGIKDTEGLDRMDAALTRDAQASRYGTGLDIANTVLFLASDAARFISGVNLHVDGASGVDLLKIPVYE
jgi:peroxisomal 2,4-dienoyl-CoA reductase